MSALNFPDPSVSQIYTEAGITWTWNTVMGVWSAEGSPPDVGSGASAWAVTNSSATVEGGFNIASCTSSSTGEYAYTFTTPMPDANYALLLTVDSGSGERVVTSTGRTADGFTVLIRNLDGAVANNRHSAVVFASNVELPPTLTPETILLVNGSNVSTGQQEFQGGIVVSGNPISSDNTANPDTTLELNEANSVGCKIALNLTTDGSTQSQGFGVYYLDDTTDHTKRYINILSHIDKAATSTQDVHGFEASIVPQNTSGYVAAYQTNYKLSDNTGSGGVYQIYAEGDAPSHFGGDITCDGLINGAFSLRMESDDPAAFETFYSGETDEEGNDIQVEKQKYIGETEDLLSIIKDLRARVAALEAGGGTTTTRKRKS